MRNTMFTHGDKVTALAAGRVQSADFAGFRRAVGDITFADQPEDGDTVTVNGVTFTAGEDFEVGASLTLTIDAIAAAMNGSDLEDVAVATYSNVGGTKLHVAFDEFGSAGNEFTLAASVATPSAATLEGGLDGDVLDLNAETKALVTGAGAVNEFDLPAGEEGQMTTIYLKTKGAGANAKVNGSFVGGTSITFDTEGEYAVLKFLGTAWAPLHNTGVLA